MKKTCKNKLIRLIQQAIKNFKLDLSGYNILLPVSLKEPALTPVMASLAGAKNIYVVSQDIDAINKTSFYENELELSSNIIFLERETPQILSSLDILIYGEGISYIDKTFVSSLKKDCVISMLPNNLDFKNITGIDFKICAQAKVPVVAVEPSDQNLMLYKYFASLLIKRCFEVDIDVFRSKILLVGCGDMLETTLYYLKNLGAQVYAAYTDKPQDQAYILKHLDDADAIIVADYPQISKQIIGNNGFILIDDIIERNPEVKIIHFSGKIEANSMSFGQLSCHPTIISQNSINVNMKEMSLKAVVESTAAVMKVGESLIKSKNRTILSGESVVTYNIINAESPAILGRVRF